MKILAVKKHSFMLLFVEDLPKIYAARTLLNEEVLTEDIAKAVRVFVDGSLSKSTGNILNVDGE